MGIWDLCAFLLPDISVVNIRRFTPLHVRCLVVRMGDVMIEFRRLFSYSHGDRVGDVLKNSLLYLSCLVPSILGIAFD